ncbi:MAG TPA: hypothetical protein VFT51_13010 [Bacillales bacterium]|nr:hypothetical protein [Bacillales bacterium]
MGSAIMIGFLVALLLFFLLLWMFRRKRWWTTPVTDFTVRIQLWEWVSLVILVIGFNLGIDFWWDLRILSAGDFIFPITLAIAIPFHLKFRTRAKVEFEQMQMD